MHSTLKTIPPDQLIVELNLKAIETNRTILSHTNNIMNEAHPGNSTFNII